MSPKSKLLIATRMLSLVCTRVYCKPWGTPVPVPSLKTRHQFAFGMLIAKKCGCSSHARTADHPLRLDSPFPEMMSFVAGFALEPSLGLVFRGTGFWSAFMYLATMSAVGLRPVSPPHLLVSQEGDQRTEVGFSMNFVALDAAHFLGFDSSLDVTSTYTCS
eukprot:6011224-Amphidinium_carterae.1